MTLDEAERARDRTAQMLRRFGDEQGAEEFESLSPEGYAARQGVELIANPTHPNTKGRKQKTMPKSKDVEKAEDAIRDAHAISTRDCETRAEMQEALEEIQAVCEEALPELAEGGDDEDE